ncbi:MAG: hypothetical protein AMS21_00645 [Gemmatimonas sp. SG8_38_2]|nr:MAG: hypothetical protein AMS21_00645 [Gemmatimonas sp. SG8_38_2]
MYETFNRIKRACYGVVSAEQAGYLKMRIINHGEPAEWSAIKQLIDEGIQAAYEEVMAKLRGEVENAIDANMSIDSGDLEIILDALENEWPYSGSMLFDSIGRVLQRREWYTYDYRDSYGRYRLTTLTDETGSIKKRSIIIFDSTHACYVSENTFWQNGKRLGQFGELFSYASHPLGVLTMSVPGVHVEDERMEQFKENHYVIHEQGNIEHVQEVSSYGIVAVTT